MGPGGRFRGGFGWLAVCASVSASRASLSISAGGMPNSRAMLATSFTVISLAPVSIRE